MSAVEDRIMPTQRRTPKDSLSTVVAREMPGWEIVTPEGVADAAIEEDAMKIAPGPSIAQLRQKFRVKIADVSDAAEPTFAPVDTSVQTVQIRPRTGGEAKTADIKNGKVTIVQG